VRIGVDATCWVNERGYGRFTRELVTAMVALAPDDQFVCFLDNRSAEAFALRAPNLRSVIVPLRESPTVAASASGNRRIRDMLRMTRAVGAEPLDVFFSPSVYTYYPLPRSLAAVVTVHDVIPERFPKLTFPSTRARLYWWMKMRLALFQARLVLTVSDRAARDIGRIHGISPDRLRVALEAPSAAYHPSASADISRAAERAGLPPGARWFIYVGGFNPHKNVPNIVRAHAALARELGDAAPQLLLVGTLDRDVFHGDASAAQQAIAVAGSESLVKWTGFVDDAELRHLHSGALALVLVSESEGFGLPAVEAAACGTPVIATTESPLPDLLAGGGIFIRPGDDVALLGAMRTMATDEAARRTFGARALAAARALSWERGASAALAAIRQAVA
jgi:glycosyltransferase involved in cell wall biosynthesis